MVAAHTAHSTGPWHRHNFAAGRVNRTHPCPVCGKPDYCEVCPDCGLVHCMRVASPHPSPYRLGGYFHDVDAARERMRAQTAAATAAAGEGRVHWDAATFVPPAPASPPPPDPQLRHDVYTALLALCPLSEAHRAHLLSEQRQLPAAALASYGTLPPRGRVQAQILGTLAERFGCALLLTVPGFVADEAAPGDSRPAAGIALLGSGLLIPYRDAEGSIRACQVRPDRGHKYQWLSSGARGGPSSGAPAHVARPLGPVRDQRIYVTEGALKAHIAACRLGAVVIGLGGLVWRGALGALAALQADGADVVVLALDADDPAAKPAAHAQVRQATADLATAAARLGYAVRVARWDHTAGKGLDDLLLAGGSFALEPWRPRVLGPDDSMDARTGGIHQSVDAGEQPDADSSVPRDSPAALGGSAEDDPTGDAPASAPLGDSPALGGATGDDVDDEGTGEPPPLAPVPESVAQQRLRFLHTEIQKRGLKPAEKLVYLNAIVKAQAYPLAVGGTPGLVRKTVAAIASGAGVTPARAGKALTYLHQLEVLTVDRRRETNTGTGLPQTITRIGPGPRVLAWDEDLPEPEHKVKDKERRPRCPSCGSTALVVHALRCMECDSIVPPAEAKAAGRAWAARERAESDDQVLDGDEDEGCLPDGLVDSTSPCADADAAGPGAVGVTAREDARDSWGDDADGLVDSTGREHETVEALATWITEAHDVASLDGRAEALRQDERMHALSEAGQQRVLRSVQAQRRRLTPAVADDWRLGPEDMPRRRETLGPDHTLWERSERAEAITRPLIGMLEACATRPALDRAMERLQLDSRWPDLGQWGQGVIRSRYDAMCDHLAWKARQPSAAQQQQEGENDTGERTP